MSGFKAGTDDGSAADLIDQLIFRVLVVFGLFCIVQEGAGEEARLADLVGSGFFIGQVLRGGCGSGCGGISLLGFRLGGFCLGDRGAGCGSRSAAGSGGVLGTAHQQAEHRNGQNGTEQFFHHSDSFLQYSMGVLSLVPLL